MGEVADAIAASRSFAWQLKNPVACALRNLQKPLVPGNLEGLQIGVTDQTCPHDDRIVLGVPTTARNKIKMIAPAVMLETRHLVYVEPFQAVRRLLQVLELPGLRDRVSSTRGPCNLGPLWNPAAALPSAAEDLWGIAESTASGGVQRVGCPVPAAAPMTTDRQRVRSRGSRGPRPTSGQLATERSIIGELIEVELPPLAVALAAVSVPVLLTAVVLRSGAHLPFSPMSSSLPARCAPNRSAGRAPQFRSPGGSWNRRIRFSREVAGIARFKEEE